MVDPAFDSERIFMLSVGSLYFLILLSQLYRCSTFERSKVGPMRRITHVCMLIATVIFLIRAVDVCGVHGIYPMLFSRVLICQVTSLIYINCTALVIFSARPLFLAASKPYPARMDLYLIVLAVLFSVTITTLVTLSYTLDRYWLDAASSVFVGVVAVFMSVSFVPQILGLLRVLKMAPPTDRVTQKRTAQAMRSMRVFVITTLLCGLVSCLVMVWSGLTVFTSTTSSDGAYYCDAEQLNIMWNSAPEATQMLCMMSLLYRAWMSNMDVIAKQKGSATSGTNKALVASLEQKAPSSEQESVSLNNMEGSVTSGMRPSLGVQHSDLRV